MLGDSGAPSRADSRASVYRGGLLSDEAKIWAEAEPSLDKNGRIVGGWAFRSATSQHYRRRTGGGA